MSCEDCIRVGLPERLCMKNKPTVDWLDNSDLLFRRHKTAGSTSVLRTLPNAQIGVDIFQLKDDSYNASQFSEPDDVLLNDNPSEVQPRHSYGQYGIIAIPVEIARMRKVERLDHFDKEFHTAVVHVPKDCNYSHAEIHFFVNGEKYSKEIHGKAPKIYFREELQKGLTVIKEFR